MASPVRYIGPPAPDLARHDGGLRPAIGVHSYQVLRANRTQRNLADDWGWTYNHAPMLAYWCDAFWIEYLSNPESEHVPPGATNRRTPERSDARYAALCRLRSAWSRPKTCRECILCQ